MHWKNLRIALKISLVFAVVLGLIATLGLISVMSMSGVEVKAQQAQLGESIRSEILQREIDHLRWAIKVSEFVDDPMATNLDAQPDPHQCAFGKWYYSDARKRVESSIPALRDVLVKIEKPHADLHASAVDIASMRAKVDMIGPSRIYETVTKVKLAEVQSLLHDLEKIAYEQSQEDEATYLSTAKRTKWIVSILTVMALPICILLGFFLSKSVSGPAGKGVAFAKKLIHGDLTAKLDLNQRDEIGKLGEALNKSAESIKTIVTSMDEDMLKLSTSSTQVRAVAMDLRSSTDASVGRSESVAAAAKQMSANMENAAAAAQHTNASVQMVAAAAEELTSTINEIARRSAEARTISEAAVSTAMRTNATVDELSVAAGEIGKVTKTISDISEQTKLLALNATIEAARAGEAGKGFAVVASEIKELAKQVADATSDISARIDAIKGATDSTKVGIGSMAGVITEVNTTILTIASAVEEQSATVTDIARSAHEVSDAMDEASRMVAETSKAANNVAKDIGELNGETRRLATLAEGLDSSSQELIRVAEDMTSLCGQFKI